MKVCICDVRGLDFGSNKVIFNKLLQFQIRVDFLIL